MEMYDVINLLFALFGLAGILVVLHELILRERLRRALVGAREGLLEEVRSSWVPSPMRGVIEEYNQTIVILRSMFRTVEECQGRFLNQRDRMNVILQSLPAALLSLSDDLQIQMANRLAKELLGHGKQEIIGLNLFDLLILAEHDREVMRDAFLYKQPLRSYGIVLLQDNAQKYYELNLDFYSDVDVEMGGVLILQDVTEHRHLQEQITQREKLVAMGQLAGGVAHELNTPLGSILGYAQLMAKNLNSSDNQGHLGVIIDETKRCSKIVRDLLNYARDERCTGEVCEINKTIREITETFISCRMRRYNISINLDLAEQELVVEGGCGQLEIVITNLLINSIQALEGVLSATIHISSRVDNGYVIVRVMDNGPGVPELIRKRIFEPFFTTKNVGEGSGLGLSISHAMLAKRGGYLSYDDGYEKGACFVIGVAQVDTKRAALCSS